MAFPTSARPGTAPQKDRLTNRTEILLDQPSRRERLSNVSIMKGESAFLQGT